MIILQYFINMRNDDDLYIFIHIHNHIIYIFDTNFNIGSLYGFHQSHVHKARALKQSLIRNSW